MEMTVLDWLCGSMLHVSRTQPTFLRHAWHVMSSFGLTNAPNDYFATLPEKKKSHLLQHGHKELQTSILISRIRDLGIYLLQR